MVTELLQKYIWLVQTFIRAGRKGLSLNGISEKWERRFDSPYSRRTFNNHREAVEEVFGIRIECDRSTNRYFIQYHEDVSDENAETAWLINTFTVNNILSLGKKRLSGRVSVEDIPSGHSFLTDIMEAMTENYEIAIGYRKYNSSSPSMYTLRPYAVKEYAKRWYIVAFCVERNALRVYGLDRITFLSTTDRTFHMPEGFDVDELFATSFGIYLPEEKARTIIFETSPGEAEYIRDLPLHGSQQEIGRDDKSVTFSLFVCPDRNLMMEFCRYGSRIKVISPPEVREIIAMEHEKAAQQYINSGTEHEKE
ncbi:MAG: WYL domain-containing protein [Bacteroidales bacterium]|nr:WYL domain-containing protein [Bacteroidales bacterium]